MEHVFLTVLGMSGTACVVILAVLLARLALRKAPKVFSYALWMVVLFRLLCPVSIQSPVGVVQPFQTVPSGEEADMWKPAASGTGTVSTVVGAPVQVPGLGAAAVPAPVPDTADTAQPEAPAHALVIDLQTAAGAVWLAGAVLLAGYSVLSLLLLRRRLVGAVPLAGEKNVYLADHIPSPFVLGLVRPKIYLPSGLPEGEREYILLHERTHIRRLDHVTRALAWLALSIHWFNPLVWLAFHLAGKDMEMSCDEAVLRKMGRDVRADYSTSLLRLSVGGRLPAGPLAFGGGDPKKRIKNVLNYKKPAFWVVALALIGVLCAGVALGTDRTEERPDTSGVDLDGIAADITMSMDQGKDGVPFVRIEGTVDGIGLERTIWNPPEWFETYEVSSCPLGQLWFEAPLCDGEVVCALDACWTDENRTSVKVTATPRALISSYSNAGNLIFTVDLSRDGGALAELEGHVPKLAPNAPELVPTEEEAVKIGRIAAKVLTAAEDFYNSHIDGWQAPPSYTPVYTMDHGYVLIEGIGDACVQWGAVFDGSASRGSLYFAKDPVYYCSRLAGKAVEGGAYWSGESAFHVNFNVNDERVSSGTICGFRIEFTIDMDTAIVLDRDFKSMVEGETLELTDAEMVEMAVALSQLMEGARDFYQNRDRSLALTYSLSQQESCVDVGGLDCGGALWLADTRGFQLAPRLDAPAIGMLGFLSVTDPRFIGGYFAETSGLLSAAYFPSGNSPQIFIGFDAYAQTDGESGWEPSGDGVYFTVDLSSGGILSRSAQYLDLGLSEMELLDLARTLAQVIQGAADFYAEAAPPQPEPPLPLEEPVRLMLASGAGSWGSTVILSPDGSFDGHYSDTDGETQYVCWFHGQFGDIRQVSAASWSMKLEELVLDTGHPIGEEWEEPGDIFHYISSLPVGFAKEDGQGKIVALEPGAEFVFYTPEASSKPGGELYGMEDPSSDLHDFWYWWPGSYHSTGEGDLLNCYGLRNVEGGDGFFDYWSS